MEDTREKQRTIQVDITKGEEMQPTEQQKTVSVHIKGKSEREGTQSLGQEETLASDINKQSKKEQSDISEAEEVHTAGQQGTLFLLRIGTILLAVVSFWATAQGMAEYVFSEEWQAYAASAAIQGILLGLNFYLPTYRRYLKKQYGKKFILDVLVVVVLFCSSWFSFVFIVGQTYGESWGVDSRLLIQKTYREQLYAAGDYAEEYQNLLREEVGEQIQDLYKKANAIGKNEINIGSTVDWEEERTNYTREEFAARSIMSVVIDAVEAALQKGAQPNVQEQSLSIVIDMRKNLEEEIDSLMSQVDGANEAVEQATSNLQSAQARLNAARSEEERASLGVVTENARTYLESRQTALQELQNRLEDYRDALRRVQFYEVNLGLTGSGSVNLVSTSLRNIQQELFKEEPDLDSLYEQATEVFQRLQSGINIGEENVEGEEYQELLTAMDSFIKNLRDYQSIRTLTVALDNMTNEMSIKADILTDNGEEWKDEWSQRLDGLKSVISGLPVYYGEENTKLDSYDRAVAANELDEVIRRYVADHNAVGQGLIYLQSPYKGLACFSLVLAFFLDISAFVTGVIIDTIEVRSNGKMAGIMRRKAQEKADLQDISMKDDLWYSSNEKTLNRYIYLNGDYSYENGKKFYFAVENRETLLWELSDGDYLPGLYVEHDEKLEKLEQRELRFLGAGAQDGIYPQKCSMQYKEGILTIATEDGTVLCSVQVEENTPVYKMEVADCKITPVQSMKTAKADMIVVALNKKGSRIVAVYFCV